MGDVRNIRQQIRVLRVTPTAPTVGVWTGAAFVAAPMAVWSGSAFITPTAIKTWNGTTWVP